MSEIDNSQLEGTNPEEELELEVDTQVETEDEVAKKDEIIRHLTARAKKAEAQLKEKGKISNTNEDLEDVKSIVSKLDLAEKKRQFGYENNLAPDEADYIFKINPKPTKELLEDPFIKGGLEAIRTAKKVNDNTPSTSSRSPRFEIPKKDDLTADDKQKAFEEFMKSRRG